MQKQIQKRIWKFLEQELMTVLAVSFVGLTMVSTYAGTTATTDLSFTVTAPGGNTITVSAPNGGESWTIGTSQNIVWTSSGSITNVMIELQRSVAGSWETIVASTDNDGSYPWIVTGAATANATIRVSEVGNATVNDTSNAVFSIVAAVTGGGGGGLPYVPAPYQPGIDSVTPRFFYNQTATELTLRGFNFKDGALVSLGASQLPSRYVSSSEVRATAPVNFPIGSYTISLRNPDGNWAVYGLPIGVYKLTVAPPGTGGVNQIYAAKWVRQSTTRATLRPGEEAVVWVEFKNVGNMPWTSLGPNPTRLGVTNPQDHISTLRGSNWIVDNRPAVMTGVGTVDARIVNPGETARFTFTLKAPTRAGRYKESFLPVVEYITWMRGKVAVFHMTVVVKRASVPSTGGVSEPTPIPQALLFIDGTERLFNKIAREVTELWRYISGWRF